MDEINTFDKDKLECKCSYIYIPVETNLFIKSISIKWWFFGVVWKLV